MKHPGPVPRSVRKSAFERRSARHAPGHGLLALAWIQRSTLSIRIHSREHRVSEIGDVNREAAEYLARPSFDIKNADQNVVWFDLPIPPADRESVGTLQRALGAVR